MQRLEIINIENKYLYYLKNERGNKYTLGIEFFDIEEKPKVGDCIYMSKELLDTKYDGYSNNYTFGSLESEYGKKNISIGDIDVIKLKIGHNEIYLKRLYG